MADLEIEILTVSQSTAKRLSLSVVVGRADGEELTEDEKKEFYIRRKLNLDK